MCRLRGGAHNPNSFCRAQDALSSALSHFPQTPCVWQNLRPRRDGYLRRTRQPRKAGFRPPTRITTCSVHRCAPRRVRIIRATPPQGGQNKRPTTKVAVGVVGGYATILQKKTPVRKPCRAKNRFFWQMCRKNKITPPLEIDIWAAYGIIEWEDGVCAPPGKPRSHGLWPSRRRAPHRKHQRPKG